MIGEEAIDGVYLGRVGEELMYTCTAKALFCSTCTIFIEHTYLMKHIIIHGELISGEVAIVPRTVLGTACQIRLGASFLGSFDKSAFRWHKEGSVPLWTAGDKSL